MNANQEKENAQSTNDEKRPTRVFDEREMAGTCPVGVLECKHGDTGGGADTRGL